MERVQTLNHRGKSIILVDLSRSSPEETLKTLPAAKQVIGKLSPKSGLILTDVTEATYNKEVSEAMKEFTAHNSPFVKASAVVGADGVRLILLNTLIFLTRREIKTFDGRDKAMEWLSSHA